MTVSFIHTADIHIGKKFNIHFNGKEGSKRRRELWETFDKTIELCQRNQVRFLFIAGDMIDNGFATMEDVTRLRDKFEEIIDTQVIIVTGNRDAYHPLSLYRFVEWSKNVHLVQNTSDIEKICFESDQLCVYGMSFGTDSPRDVRKKLYELRTDANYFNVLVIHAEAFNVEDHDLYVDFSKVVHLFDYIALGHVHQYEEIQPHVVYPGTPEPLGFEEKGQHGIIYGRLDESGFEKVFVPTAKSKFITKEIYLQSDYSKEKMMDIIKYTGDFISVSKDYYRIYLKGWVNVTVNMDEVKTELSHYFQYIEFIDDFKYDFQSLVETAVDEEPVGDIMKAIYQSSDEGDMENLDYQKSLRLVFDKLLEQGRSENDD